MITNSSMGLLSRRFGLLIAIWLGIAAASGCAAIVRPNFTQTLTELRAGEYALDKEHAYVNFKIEHLGLSTVVGRFNRVDASLDFDPGKVTDLQLDGVIQTESIDMNNAELESLLRGSSWLDTSRFAEATFSTTSVSAVSENTFDVEGDLTLRGITKTLSLEATFKGGADNLLTGKYTLGFSASGSFLRSDFGIDAFAALVADEVFIEIHAEFQKTDS